VSAPSPIADEALEEAADLVSKALRVVRQRAPVEVRRRVREVLARVFDVVHGETEDTQADVAARVALARELELLGGELRGRTIFVPTFYEGGRLAILHAWDPIKIRGSIDDRRVLAHLRRYQGRVMKAERRLHWFMRRCGITPPSELAPELKPWERPYAEFEENHELLWGRLNRSDPGPG
jgi:hypothetical protein